MVFQRRTILLGQELNLIQYLQSMSVNNSEDVFLIDNHNLLELLILRLSVGSCLAFRAKGSSMWPLLKDGDKITISSVKTRKLLIGDVVAFRENEQGRLIIHRLVGRKDGLAIIKGDNHIRPDGLFPVENIIGIISNVKRNGKDVSFGFGPERFLVALLSRMGLLRLLFHSTRLFTSLIFKIFKL